MIKRIAILSLLLVYLSTTVGFALTMHFCGTKISNVRINQSAKKACCKSEAETKPDKCCKDQHIKIKVSDQQQSIQLAKVPAATGIDLFLFNSEISLFKVSPSNLLSTLSYRGPPVADPVPLTIQNCIFRI